MKSLISVIVPVYNTEKFVGRCINSIIVQTYKFIEIILINDGSTDQSGNICDEFAKKDKRITVIHKKNGGVSTARNVGISIAKGEFVTFVDSDDYIEPQMLERLISLCCKENVDIAACSLKKIELDGTIHTNYNSGSIHIIEKCSAIKAFFVQGLIKELFYGPFAKIFRRDLLKALRFDETLRMGEDILFNFQCIENSLTIGVLEECLYHYIVRENSAMTSKFSDKRMDYIKAVYCLEEICKEKYTFALDQVLYWGYLHRLITCSQLLQNPQYCEKYSMEFKVMKQYLIDNSKLRSNLEIKKKVRYLAVVNIPKKIHYCWFGGGG